jgi:hypothetical protein
VEPRLTEEELRGAVAVLAEAAARKALTAAALYLERMAPQGSYHLKMYMLKHRIEPWIEDLGSWVEGGEH